jgi:hypothetical protein
MGTGRAKDSVEIVSPMTTELQGAELGWQVVVSESHTRSGAQPPALQSPPICSTGTQVFDLGSQ